MESDWMIYYSALEHQMWFQVLSWGWTIYLIVLSVLIVLEKRSPISTVGWILALSFVPWVGFIIYYFLGPQRFKKQRLKRLRSRAIAQSSRDVADALEATDPAQLRQLPELGQATCGLPLATATDVQLLSGGHTTYQAIFDAVRGARDHVHLEYYIYEPDETGTALRDLLIERAKAGVEVRLLLDALGSKKVNARFLKPLLDAGAEVLRFHDTRIGRRWRPVTNYRTHRKIVVVDGLIGFTGGVNITDEEDTTLRNDAYHDVHLRIEGNAVRWLQTTFIEDWVYATGERPKTDENRMARLYPHAESGSYAVQIVTSGPDNVMEPIHRVNVQAIQSAEKRLWLTTPYFVPDDAALTALTSAALRGVDVRLMVPRTSDSRVVTFAARSFYDELMAAGVKVWEYKARMLHSKTMLVDDNCGMVGTANFDHRSFRLNYEVMAVVYDQRLCDALEKQFNIDLQSAARVRNPRKLRFPPRLGEATARLFSPML